MTGDWISNNIELYLYCISDIITFLWILKIIENFCHYNFFFNDVEESLQLYSNGCLLSTLLHPLYRKSSIKQYLKLNTWKLKNLHITN